MSPDGFPIYEESSEFPGAFVVTCHSGVTLAAAHALKLAPQLLEKLSILLLQRSLQGGSMFNRLPNIIRKSITFYFDNEPIEALEGDTIASALLSAGVVDFEIGAL